MLPLMTHPITNLFPMEWLDSHPTHSGGGGVLLMICWSDQCSPSLFFSYPMCDSALLPVCRNEIFVEQVLRWWMYLWSQDWWDNFMLDIWDDVRWIQNFQMTKRTMDYLVDLLALKNECLWMIFFEFCCKIFVVFCVSGLQLHFHLYRSPCCNLFCNWWSQHWQSCRVTPISGREPRGLWTTWLIFWHLQLNVTRW